MKKTLSIPILAVLPAIALAAGDYAGGHGMDRHQGMQGHDMAGMPRDMHVSMAGKPGDPAKVGSTIEVIMDDSMRFTPDKISVKASTPVRFFVRNKGKVGHQMMIGTMDELKRHAETMRTMPDMQHAEPNIIALAPGQRGGIVWQFDKPGEVAIACLVPGHIEAGMVGKVEVR